MRGQQQSGKNHWLPLLLCALSLVGLGVTIVPQSEPGSILTGGTVWALAAIALWILYREVSRYETFGMKRLWILAVLFSGIVVLGQSYGTVGSAALVKQQPLLAVWKLAGGIPLYAAIMALVTNALCYRHVCAAEAAEGKRPLAFWQYALIIYACWLPYLFLLYPGTVSTDSITMLMEAIGMRPLGNANPIFQTMLLHGFRYIGVKLGNGDISIILYCGIQSVLMAWLLGILVMRISQSEAPRWLGVAALVFFAVNPIFPLYAFCVGKDTNFAMAVLWLMLCCHQHCEQEKHDRRNTLFMIAASVLCVLLRNPGMYLAVLTLAALLLWTLGKARRSLKRWIAPALSIVCAVCVFAGIRLMLPVLGVAPMPETEEYSLPLQQVARVAATHELTPEEQQALNGVLELERVAGEYNGELSDPIKNLWRTDVTPDQKAAFFRTWLKLAVKHPGTCLSATFHNTYGYLYPGFMSQIKPTFLIGRQRSTAELDPYFHYSANPHCDLLIRFTDELAKNPLYRIIVAPGLYGWITLFAFVLLLGRGKCRYLIAAIPALFTLAGCVLSAVNGYFRYAMPLYLCAPMLLWLCALAKTDSGRENV